MLVKNKLLKLKLLIVGDGPLKNQLKKFVKKLKLKDIVFYSWTNKPLKLLRKANIFLFSSN